MTEKRPGRFPWLVYCLVLLAILVISLWPVASVFFTYLVADASGCQVNEGSVQPCMVMGSDWGRLLYATGVMGWFMLATVPLGALAFAIWLAVLVIHRIAWGRKEKK